MRVNEDDVGVSDGISPSSNPVSVVMDVGEDELTESSSELELGEDISSSTGLATCTSQSVSTTSMRYPSEDM